MPQDGYGSVSAPEDEIERATDYKPDEVTWGDVLVAGAERLNDAIDSDDGTYLPDTPGVESIGDALENDELAIIGRDEVIVNKLADRLSGEQNVSLEASERRAIAEEVAEVLQA